MNFVDVQPRSFLDYAWTTPSPGPGNNLKSKTSRKQNRCCDQCRKGKRACDAAILEDTLLGTDRSNGSKPTVFHYSDVFGPLAPCSNCDKTKKNCTFDWLRSQRVSQGTPQASTGPPVKKRRKNSLSSASPDRKGTKTSARARVAPHTTRLSEILTPGGDSTIVTKSSPDELALTFADFPGNIPACDLRDFYSADAYELPFEQSERTPFGAHDAAVRPKAILEDTYVSLLDDGSEHSSSVGTLHEDVVRNSDGDSSTTCSMDTAEGLGTPQVPSGASTRISRKRRRHASYNRNTKGLLLGTPLPIGPNVLSSVNNVFLAEGLLRVYHDSFENALSCWLTERTCPYSKASNACLTNNSGPDWNRIYYRVYRLDRLASRVRGRNLTIQEERAASKAVNLAIFAFATQWAQSSERANARYPFRNEETTISGLMFGSSDGDGLPPKIGAFDRALQVSAWHEARLALHDAAAIESFRVVLAQIVFSLTQRPFEMPSEDEALVQQKSSEMYGTGSTLIQEDTMCAAEVEDSDVDECEKLLSKLNLTMESEGPPVHLEQGLRLIHSLRSRMAMCSKLHGTRRTRPPFRCPEQPKPSADCFDAADRATVDLLFWLGIMFDTLSSAMHKRPLVVSDEDSDIYTKGSNHGGDNAVQGEQALSSLSDAGDGLWDQYLLVQQEKRLHASPTRWPCSFGNAASLLCDAAPVKVLLFRKITRIQTLISRNFRGQKIESAIGAALDVYYHWKKVYEPFLRDCVENHERLPSKVQSWHVCLAGHWHFATLLLADLVEIVDSAELGIDVKRHDRAVTGFVSSLRGENCNMLSDLARCACPREDSSFAKSGEFHFAVNQGALLTEPWTVVLIRAFAQAAIFLLRLEAEPGSSAPDPVDEKDAFRRADDCVKALWHLGRKSDMALSAAKILGDALRQRRKGLEERLSDMSCFLKAEFLEGSDPVGEAHGIECV